MSLMQDIVTRIDRLEKMFDRLSSVETVAASSLNPFRVSEVWESDNGAVALQAGATGDIGIGASSTGAKLHSFGSSGSQLRLAQAATVSTLFSVDSNHDMTIQPTSTGQVILKSTTNAADFFQVRESSGSPIMTVATSTKWVGINIANPATVVSDLELATTGNSGFVAVSYSTTATFAGEPVMTLFKSHNGSIGSLSPTIDTERLGRFDFAGVDSASAIRSTAGLRVTQVGAASAANVPSKMDLVAANNAAVMTLDENKNVLIDNAAGGTAAAQLHVDQSSTTAAEPVLYLDQADISEEFIEFNSTIGTGNAIEAVGAKTLTTTHFIKVTIPGGLTRYFPIGTIA